MSLPPPAPLPHLERLGMNGRRRRRSVGVGWAVLWRLLLSLLHAERPLLLSGAAAGTTAAAAHNIGFRYGDTTKWGEGATHTHTPSRTPHVEIDKAILHKFHRVRLPKRSLTFAAPGWKCLKCFDLIPIFKQSKKGIGSMTNMGRGVS